VDDPDLSTFFFFFLAAIFVPPLSLFFSLKKICGADRTTGFDSGLSAFPLSAISGPSLPLFLWEEIISATKAQTRRLHEHPIRSVFFKRGRPSLVVVKTLISLSPPNGISLRTGGRVQNRLLARLGPLDFSTSPDQLVPCTHGWNGRGRYLTRFSIETYFYAFLPTGFLYIGFFFFSGKYK